MRSLIKKKNNFHIISQIRYYSTPTIHKHLILTYKYVDNALEKRVPLRQQHLEYINSFSKGGKLVYGGATNQFGSDQPTGALIVFKDTTEEEAKQIATNDPYVTGSGQAPGIVTSWEIKEWNVVVGSNIKEKK